MSWQKVSVLTSKQNAPKAGGPGKVPKSPPKFSWAPTSTARNRSATTDNWQTSRVATFPHLSEAHVGVSFWCGIPQNGCVPFGVPLKRGLPFKKNKFTWVCCWTPTGGPRAREDFGGVLVACQGRVSAWHEKQCRKRSTCLPATQHSERPVEITSLNGIHQMDMVA